MRSIPARQTSSASEAELWPAWELEDAHQTSLDHAVCMSSMLTVEDPESQ